MKKSLAFNYSATSALKRKYQLLLGALPMVCMFAPFVPMLKLASWLDSPAGGNHNPAASSLLFVLLWALLGLVVMSVAMLVGYAIGWILNMTISLVLLKWPWARLRAVFLESKMPAEWYKDGIVPQSQPDSAADKDWELVRSQGFTRFMIKQGVLAWGAPMFLAMYVIPTLIRDVTVEITGVLANIGIWIVAGCGFGASTWWWRESQYRKRSQR